MISDISFVILTLKARVEKYNPKSVNHMSNQQRVVLLAVHLKCGGCVEFATMVTEDLEDGAHREFQVSTDLFDPNSVRHSGILGSIWVIALCLSVLHAFVRLKTSNSG